MSYALSYRRFDAIACGARAVHLTCLYPDEPPEAGQSP